MDSDVKIVLKSGKDISLIRRHPWIFSGAIKKIYGDPVEGELVHVYNNKDEFLAQGHFQPGSIAVRIISFQHQELNGNFWREKFKSAWQLRKELGLIGSSSTNVYRLFHAEGDNIPGLIIDYYNGHVVLQIHSVGIYHNLPHILQALRELYGDRLMTVYSKSKSTLPAVGNIIPKDEFLLGNTENTLVSENNLKFRIEWKEGQKTGFFIDQRENRTLLQKYSANRDVLNMFSYTGGFTMYSLAGKAKNVHSVDSSARAIELTNVNVNLNFINAPHEAYNEDAFRFMDKIKDKYDLIVLDPPAFAKHQSSLYNALQGYKRLNQIVLEQIRPGGILFTFSCSQVVSKENFRKSVFAAAVNAKRNVRILHQLTQPGDHPVNIFHPEGEYLKGLVLYVE
jgi:23S rRNA (cytosine1962-C5)-methyltransferase